MGASEFRRRYDRKVYGADVNFSVAGKSFGGWLKDISVGGAFVTTMAVNQVYRGDVITLSIPFTDGRTSVKRRARVLWTSGEGFAAEFL